MFEIERAAVPRFGIRAYGVHVNGFIKKSGSVHLWIGQRAQDKATYPGKLDNMVAGGQPVGIGLRENVLKEAYEEASVPRSIANQAISVGAITYCHGFSGGVKPDVMFVFDMEMPENFTPKIRWRGPILRVIASGRGTKICAETLDFKFNCSLVNIDFFIRHGIRVLTIRSSSTSLLVAQLRKLITKKQLDLVWQSSVRDAKLRLW